MKKKNATEKYVHAFANIMTRSKHTYEGEIVSQ